MENITSDKSESKKLVNDLDLSNVEDIRNSILTNRKIRRITEPYIRGKKVKGKNYYYYCRGTNTEIYLGSAEVILQAVQAAKIASGKNGP